MAAPFNLEDLAKLKSFVEFVGANPAILNMPQLDFFKKLIERFGGVVPEGTFQMPAGAKCPFSGDVKSESKSTPNNADEEETEIPEMEAESEESEVELDMEAHNSRPILEPILYVEEKPLKAVEGLKLARRKISTKRGLNTRTISKVRKNISIKRNIQQQNKHKLKFEYNLHEDNENENIKSTIANDPLSTRLRKVKCELNKEKFENHAQDENESKLYVDSDNDEDYEDDDNDEFNINLAEKDTDVKDEEISTDNDYAEDDDEPLILLTDISSKKTYKKKPKTPRLKSCLESCKHKCTTKFNKQQRLEVFDYYWHLNKEDKVKFIRKHIRKPVIKRLRSKKRNNCCYFLKYISGKACDIKQPVETQTDTLKENSDDDEDLKKVCRKFFDGTLNISDRDIKEAFKDYALKPERFVCPHRDKRPEDVIKLGKKLAKQTQQQQQYLYLDPETGDLTDTKPKKKNKRRKRGEPPLERFPKPINCAIRCKFKCHQKFSEVERKQICDIFWSLDFKRRKDFILSRIETTDVKNPITPEFRKTNRPTRAYQTKFYLRSGPKSEDVRVCKHFILNTLCINRWFIENAIEFADKTTGAYTGSDRRGVNGAINKISDDRKQTVLDHIESYPYWIPNKKSKTKYLHYSLTIKKMYEAYKEKSLAEKIDYVSLHYYYKVFHTHFHILFLANPHPRKGRGFFKTNPNLSHYTGNETGGCWMDSKGNQLDIRSINPAVTLDIIQYNMTNDSCNPIIVPESAAHTSTVVQH